MGIVWSSKIPYIPYFLALNDMTPEQSRAARGWLGWSQGELARRANVSLSTVHDFERGQRTPTANNLASMRRAIEAAGIRLVFDQDGAAAGVLRRDAKPDLSGNTSD
jgi:ribosome-binding protein aMBF1 (putative translation factor)